MGSFKNQPKEKKKSKVIRLSKFLREKTGLGRAQADDIADAVIRNRDLDRLAVIKGWPIVNGVIEGPDGPMPLTAVREAL